MQVTFTGTPTEVVQETLAFLQVLGGRANPTPAPAQEATPAAQETKTEPKAPRAPRAPKEAPAAMHAMGMTMEEKQEAHVRGLAQSSASAPKTEPAPAKEEVKEEPPLDDGAFRSAASRKIFERLAALKKDADIKTEPGKANVTAIQKFVFEHLKYAKFGDVPPTERRDVLAKLDTILAAYK